MYEAMKKIVAMNVSLTQKERNHLSVAIKNIVGSKRVAWRIIFSIHHKQTSLNDQQKATCALRYKREIERELKGMLEEALEIYQSLLERATTADARYFFIKSYV